MRDFLATSWWTENTRHTSLFILYLITVTMLTAILLGAHGVRGTDQYWYLADVTTLIEGREPLSNLYFPRIFIEGQEHANFFIHNGPALHLSAQLGKLIGAFNGWLAVNLISHLITAACIYLSAIRYTSRPISTACCFLYLVSPIAIWQSMNMMQEQFYGALLATIVLAFSYRSTKAAKIYLHLVLICSIAIHPVFTAIGLAYILTCIFKSFQRKKTAELLGMLILAAVCGVVYHLYYFIFPTTFQPTVLSVIRGSVPNLSSMLWHYSDSLPAIDSALLFYKLRVAAAQHTHEFFVYFYTNLAALSAVYLLLFSRQPKQRRNLICLLCFILGLYFAITVLMQAQPRYQQIFASASFLLIALALNDIRAYLSTTTKNIVFTTIASATITIGVYLCYTANVQAKQEEHSLAQIAIGLESLPSGSNIMLVNSDHETKLAYILSPRKVLSVKTHLLTTETYQRTIEIFQPGFIVSTRPIAQFPVENRRLDTLYTDYLGSFYLYQIDKPDLVTFRL